MTTREKERAWKIANRGRIRESERERYRANPEKHRARNKRWYIKHRDKIRARKRELYLINLEKNREYAKRWHQENPDKILKYFVKSKYGISIEKYDELLKSQDGRCAICKMPSSKRRLHIDHDHETNEVRGLLCQPCNHGIGNFRESVVNLVGAIEYLSRHIELEVARAS